MSIVGRAAPTVALPKRASIGLLGTRRRIRERWPGNRGNFFVGDTNVDHGLSQLRGRHLSLSSRPRGIGRSSISRGRSPRC
jgi:hypothetical protein